MNITRPVTPASWPVSVPAARAGKAALISASDAVRGTPTGNGARRGSAISRSYFSRRTRICSGRSSAGSSHMGQDLGGDEFQMIDVGQVEYLQIHPRRAE